MQHAGLRQSADPQTSIERLRSATPFLVNDDLSFWDWLNFAYAFWRASGGSEDGFTEFDSFSRKSARKYNSEYTAEIWKTVGRSCRSGNAKVTRGAGTIFFHAKLRGWEPFRLEDDPKYRESVDAEADERASRGAVRPTPRPAGGNGSGPPPLPPEPDPPLPGPEPPSLPPPPGPEPPPRETEYDDFVLPIEFSENMLAYLFSRQHAARLVYVHGWGKWMRWDGGRWCEDFAVTVFDEARKICAVEGERALHTLPERTAKKIAAIINKAACAAAIERLARHHAPQVRHVDVFDADPARLNGPRQSQLLKGS
jgi:hypothetical protein